MPAASMTATATAVAMTSTVLVFGSRFRTVPS
jgi:hypothetical protein